MTVKKAVKHTMMVWIIMSLISGVAFFTQELSLLHFNSQIVGVVFRFSVLMTIVLAIFFKSNRFNEMKNKMLFLQFSISNTYMICILLVVLLLIQLGWDEYYRNKFYDVERKIKDN